MKRKNFLTDRQKVLVRCDLRENTISDRGMSLKYNVTLATIHKEKDKVNTDNYYRKVVPVIFASKMTGYYTDHPELNGEELLLSSPYYNPLELKGEEKDLLNKILSDE